jgi:hypothetical protein
MLFASTIDEAPTQRCNPITCIKISNFISEHLTLKMKVFTVSPAEGVKEVFHG